MVSGFFFFVLLFLWKSTWQCWCLYQGSGPVSSCWSTPILSSLLPVHGLPPRWAMTTQRDLDMVSEALSHFKTHNWGDALWVLKTSFNINTFDYLCDWCRCLYGGGGCLWISQRAQTLSWIVTAVPVNTICLIWVKTLAYFPFKV